MPWATQLDGYYSQFGNGYVPFFAVIGVDYTFVHGGNSVSGAMNAAEDAMGEIITHPAPENPAGLIDYPQVILSWEEPETGFVITGYNVYRNGVRIGDTPENEFTYTDYPSYGDHVYTVRTQYIVQESGDSDPINISYFNTPGDVDANAQVESFDASLVLYYAVGIEPPSFLFPWADWRIQRADVDQNGTVEAYDCSLILQYVVGIISGF